MTTQQSSIGATRFAPDREWYKFTNGWSMVRETPGAWWLRDDNGDVVDTDRYRHDIMPRYDLTIAEHHDPYSAENRSC